MQRNRRNQLKQKTMKSRRAILKTKEKEKVRLLWLILIEILENAGFEEPTEERAIQKFLQNLPGVTATDSQTYRIEALRVYLEDNLGETSFIAAYKHYINVSEFNEDVESEIESILGKKKMKFFTLIYQLIVWEDTYYNKSFK